MRTVYIDYGGGVKLVWSGGGRFAQNGGSWIYSSFHYEILTKRCRMYKKGLTVVLTQPIEGKKDRFEKGLKGTIVESFELAHGKSYRVQFMDGRVARFPEELMNQAIEVVS